jgi:hypothetical protein
MNLTEKSLVQQNTNSQLQTVMFGNDIDTNRMRDVSN